MMVNILPISSLLLTFLQLVHLNEAQEKKDYGPFSIKIEKTATCDNEGSKVISLQNLEIQIEKYTFWVSGTGVTKVPIDDNMLLAADIWSLKEDGSIYNAEPYKIPLGPPCEAIAQLFPKSFKKLMGTLGIKGCPIPAGTYTLKKFPFELHPVLQVQSFLYRKFKMDFYLESEKRRLACIRMFVATVPEQ